MSKNTIHVCAGCSSVLQTETKYGITTVHPCRACMGEEFRKGYVGAAHELYDAKSISDKDKRK